MFAIYCCNLQFGDAVEKGDFGHFGRSRVNMSTTLEEVLQQVWAQHFHPLLSTTTIIQTI